MIALFTRRWLVNDRRSQRVQRCSMVAMAAGVALALSTVQSVTADPGDCLPIPSQTDKQYKDPALSFKISATACGDSNGDGVVNAVDYVDFVLKAQQCANGPTATPQDLMKVMNQLPQVCLGRQSTADMPCSSIKQGAALVFQQQLGRLPDESELLGMDGGPDFPIPDGPCQSPFPPKVPVPASDLGPVYCMGINCDLDPEEPNGPVTSTPGPILCCGTNCVNITVPPPNPSSGTNSLLRSTEGIYYPPYQPAEPKPFDIGPCDRPIEIIREVNQPSPSIDNDGIAVPEQETTDDTTPQPPIMVGTASECGAPQNGGTGSNSGTGNPVRVAKGDKYEDVVDLQIELTGRDFTVERMYTSAPDYSDAPLAGNRWSIPSLFTFVVPDGAGGVGGRGRRGSGFVSFNSSGVPQSAGLVGLQSMSQTTISVPGVTSPVAVWKLTSSGTGDAYFYRHVSGGPLNAALDGMLLEARDLGYNQAQYEYTFVGNTPRLAKISFRSQEGYLEAALYLQWYAVPGNASHAINGKLGRLIVHRYPGGTPLEVERVEYTYKTTTDGFSADVGTPGDLIQVTRFVRVDGIENDNPSGPNSTTSFQPGYPCRTSVTQYRYHDGRTAATTGDERLNVTGLASQLKAVINSQQIEYVGQQINRAGTLEFPSVAARYAATRLMERGDSALAFTDATGNQYKVVDIAGKWVGYDVANATESRVNVEYVQSNCGCGGGASQGFKQVFTYTNWTDGGAQGISGKIQEFGRAVSCAYTTLRRTLFMDYRRLNEIDYLESYAIRAPDVANSTWTWKYEYDAATGNLLRRIDPSAGTTYVPATGSSGPSITVSSTAVVHHFAYANNRRTQESVSVGLAGTPSLLWRMTYPTGDTPTTRTYWPTKFESFPDGSTTDESKIETTWIDYQFRDATTTNPNPNSLAWKRISREAERPEENGPDTGWSGVEKIGVPVYSVYDLYDNAGRHVFRRNADWSVAAFGYSAGSVQPTTAVINADPNSYSSVWSQYPSLSTTGWGTLNGLGSRLEAGEATFTYTFDPSQRVRSVTNPKGIQRFFFREFRSLQVTGVNERPGAFYYTRVSLPHAAGSTYDKPLVLSAFDASGALISKSSHLVQAGTTTAPYGAQAYALSGLVTPSASVARTTIVNAVSGLPTETRTWYSTEPGNYGVPTGETPYYATKFDYDQFGRLIKTTYPNLSVSEIGNAATGAPGYDALNRVIATWAGKVGQASSLQAEYFYDDPNTDEVAERGVGDGRLSWSIEYAGENGSTSEPGVPVSSSRREFHQYDGRGRVALVRGPEAPYVRLTHDNIDRVTQIESYASKSGAAGQILADRTNLLKVMHSQRGTAYSTQIAVNPTSATPQFLRTDSWFDGRMRLLATRAPNQSVRKGRFDGFGRMVTSWVTDGNGDVANGPGSFATATNVDDDRVLEQTDITMDVSNRPALLTARVRVHDSAALGSLSLPTNLSQSVATFDGYSYDPFGRVVAKVDFGTNDDDFKAATSAPSISILAAIPTNYLTDPIWAGKRLVTKVAYDERGLPTIGTDPNGRKTRAFYDALLRPRVVVENYDDSAGAVVSWNASSGRWAIAQMSPTDGSKNRATSYVYAIASGSVTQYAHTLSGGTETVQATKYVYGTTAESATDAWRSLIASGHLLSAIHYPLESTGQPGLDDAHTVRYGYNRLGEVRGVKDQNGTIHAYTRDYHGRVVADIVQQFGPGIDQSVGMVLRRFDRAGRLDQVESRTPTNTTVNAVELAYGSLGQVTDLYQNHAGPVDRLLANGTRKVSYAYDSSVPNRFRSSGMTYPNGSTLQYSYGAGLDDSISRVTTLAWGSAATDEIVRYSYLGQGFFAAVDYTLPNILLDRTYSHDGKRRTRGQTTQIQGLYPGFDRFGRIARHAWVDADTAAGAGSLPTKPPIVEDELAYDAASNRTKTYDRRPGVQRPDRDMEALFDGLNRVTAAKRGAAGTTWTPAKNSQEWTLDQLGNWTETRTDSNGDGSYTGSGETEQRPHNAANQIVQRQFVTAPVSPPRPLAYDAAGNTVSHKKSTSSTSLYTYDAWNRLVRITSRYQHAANPPVDTVVADYGYNGLHWRTFERSGHGSYNPANIPPDYSGQETRFYYSAGWKLIQQETVNDFQNSSTITRQVQHVWGQRYVDDAVMQRSRTWVNGAWTSWLSGYHLTDTQYSTVAVVDQSGMLQERVQYQAYGLAFHRWPGDFNGDDLVDSRSDGADLQSRASMPRAITDPLYDADYDLNRDGLINSADVTRFQLYLGRAPAGDGQISGWNGNIIGYGGYVYSKPANAYAVRYRWYDPNLGRWMTKDPLGYVDGANLYEYGRGMALNTLDPSGLLTMENLRYKREHGNFGNTIVAGCGSEGPSRAQRLWYTINHEFQSTLQVLENPEGRTATARGYLEGGWDGIVRTAAVGADMVTFGVFDFTHEADALMFDPSNPMLDYTTKLAEFGFTTLSIARALPERVANLCINVCFAGDTPVLTDEGLKRIDEIQPGDLVWSVNVETGSVDLVPVTETFESQALELVEIHIGNEVIRCTPQHPFWVEGKGWTEAQDLWDGSALRLANGVVASVECVELVCQPMIVYNLQVGEGASYFVGEHAVLVHNGCVYGIIKDGVLYIGRTSRSVAERIAEHGVKDTVFRLEGLTYNQMRGAEQILIDSWSAVRNLGNKIRGISPNNPLIGRYIKEGRRKISGVPGLFPK